MGWQAAALNAMVDGVGAIAAKASLHSADPGATGASELAGGTPAYARKTVGWAAAANGERALDADYTFDVPAGSDVAYVGFWTAADAWLGGFALAATESYAAQGQYILKAANTKLDVNAV